jgi:tetratricopeptide (TPR) repeat protein
VSPDTTADGRLLDGMWAAAAGDVSTAHARAVELTRRSTVEQRGLGLGPRLLRARILAGEERWSEAVDELEQVVEEGDRGGWETAAVPGMAVRWSLAESYEQTGALERASETLERALDPKGTPFGQLEFRGLMYSFTLRRLAQIYDRLNRADAAAARWKQFRAVFVTPDRDLSGT